MAARVGIETPRASIETLIDTVIALLREAEQEIDIDALIAQSNINRAIALLNPPDRPLASQRSGGRLATWQEREVRAYVGAHLGEAVATEDLCMVAGLSISHFSNSFCRTFGETPYKYVMRRRIERAKELMLATQVPLSQIALSCGLSDQAHLSRLFRRFVGASPGFWRRQQRDMSQAGRSVTLMHRGILPC